MPPSIFLPPEQTRLVTIAAHVDHGKTTLADNLIEHNGIISERLAGTLRYLDSDPEEQRRGITMRTSAIGLKHTYKSKQHQQEDNHQEMIVHLLDSPGHTDFSLEVSAALAACDSCLVVIDAVEGMAPRTHQVLREAHAHQLVPVLIINKLDRLYADLGLSPTEAYVRLRSLLETVNAAASSLLTSAALHQDILPASDSGQGAARTVPNNNNSSNSTGSSHYHPANKDYESWWTFEPVRGNVIFASALYGWGFTVQSLARALFKSKQVTVKPMILKQCLFSDAKLKNGKILKWKHGDDQPPIFAEYGLHPIWNIFEGVAAAAAAVGHPSGANFANHFSNNSNATSSKAAEMRIKATTPGMDLILAALQSGATGEQSPKTTEAMQSILTGAGSTTEESVLRALLRRYRPLSDTVLDVVSEYCPSPRQAATSVRTRVLRLQQPTNPEPGFQQQLDPIAAAVRDCCTDLDAPTVAYVGKFMAVDRVHIRDPELDGILGGTSGAAAKATLILGLARVLSGHLRTGHEYYLLGPKYQGGQSESTCAIARTVRLYLLMGSSFLLVDSVPAGHLCGVYNLEGIQLKTVTLSDSPFAMPMQGFDHFIRPLVKVNVEPDDPADTAALELGLVKLSLADASVEVTATGKGERILSCLGELHLEQSIHDLETIYCGKPMKLRTSDRIVDFGETTDWFEHEFNYTAFFDDPAPPLRQTTIPPYNETEGLAHAHHGRARSILSGRGAAISLRTVPFVPSVYQAVEKREVVKGSEEELLKLGRALGLAVGPSALTASVVLGQLLEMMCYFDPHGNAIMESPSLREGLCVRGVESELGEVFAPKKVKSEDGPDETRQPGFAEYESLRDSIRSGGRDALDRPRPPSDQAARSIWADKMKGSAVAGFQLAVRAGWICEEPLRNVAVVLEGVEVALTTSSESSYQCVKTLSGGMVVAALRSGIRCAMLTRPARLMESHLRLTLHSSLAGIGALYSVLSKRRGRVVEDSVVDGTDLLLITALIPQAESFGLAPELYGKTSGEVTAPEMVFSHWERLDIDPFWIPSSLEEREDFGELQMAGDSSTGVDNTALHYIRKVRQRKGLMVDSTRTVIAAEKQRTLKK